MVVSNISPSFTVVAAMYQAPILHFSCFIFVISFENKNHIIICTRDYTWITLCHVAGVLVRLRKHIYVHAHRPSPQSILQAN